MSKSGKQGIFVLIFGSVLQLFLGIIYVWSVFVKPVTEMLNWKEDSVKLTSSFMLCCFVLGILIGGKLQVKTGTRAVVLAGGLLLSAGMLATSFIPSGAAFLIYITYGIVGGFGVGMAYNAIISCAQKWFPKKRGLATGISVCAFGFSTVLFAPLIETLVGSYGVVNTFRILAAAFFVVVAAFFYFIKLPDDSGQAASPASEQLMKKKQYTTGQILKTKQFYYITLSLMLGTAAYFILNPSFKSFAEERNLADIGTIIVMITGIANALGRLVVPLVSDKIGRERAALSILLATMVSTLVLCYAGGIPFMAAIAVIAFCYGGYSGIYPLITADYFGIKNVGSNYGAVMVGFALSALFFPMLVGLVGNMTAKFFVLTVLAAAGAVMVILLMLSNKKQAGVKE